MFKAGDRVRVWSLQSFSYGGFLNGEEAIVRQDQVGDSVLLIVVRNFSGIYQVDPSYEVYARQCELMAYKEDRRTDYEKAINELPSVYQKIRNGENVIRPNP